MRGESSGPRSRGRAAHGRTSPVFVFALAFVMLIGAAVSVVAAQFSFNRVAAWMSIAYSASAFLLTAVALFIRSAR